ncbi:hypothetical protein K437DRAFT_80334 [Tilletiaria anomala UBC 951]|uniref:Uncharacterized protein n=1 Tax=Tilletiaria anomala (strain ATCC 24038 / CBS 436.72 / UBC 951) TaxID=1037660 RepID=A0A066V9X8_TILAU|nr:uncharacterized protein K437DRAFT_80334 [Tilletiaria anomala UBC 951]KDN35350.1 hypothetical protein K437DRAFT_80334 [Tilletiaria anomala UBC 951]
MHIGIASSRGLRRMRGLQKRCSSFARSASDRQHHGSCHATPLEHAVVYAGAVWCSTLGEIVGEAVATGSGQELVGACSGLRSAVVDRAFEAWAAIP